MIHMHHLYPANEKVVLAHRDGGLPLFTELPSLFSELPRRVLLGNSLSPGTVAPEPSLAVYLVSSDQPLTVAAVKISSKSVISRWASSPLNKPSSIIVLCSASESRSELKLRVIWT